MAAPRRSRSRTVAIWAASLTAAAVFVTGAVVAQGYDAEDLPALETTVWVTRDAAGGQYAKVNTDIAEIAAVRAAHGLDGVAQTGSIAYVLGSGSTRLWPLDAASPADIGTDDAGPQPGGPAEGATSPVGTTGLLAVGDYLLFTGATPAWARAGEVDESGAPITRPLEPRLDPGAGDRSGYVAAAASISRGGVVAMYSTRPGERRIVRYDVERGQWDTASLADPPDTPTGLQLSFVGDRWVLFQAASDGSRLWVAGRDAPFELPGIGGDGLLQSPGTAADTVAIASATGLALVDLADGTVGSVAAGGTPARPVAVGDGLAAAWLTTGSGTMWTSAAGLVDLVIDGGEFEQNVDVAPTLATNGGRAVLVESTTGMLWSVPDGELIPLAAWTAGEPPPQAGEVEVPDASTQEPPVAEPDAFGVRAGAVAMLPVLYNDHDANSTDVLSIDPESVEGLDPAFGTARIVGSGQSLVVDVVGGTRSATLSYRVTDGTTVSAPTTVSLTLADGNAAPVWCDEWAEPACYVDWPSPQLAVGGTIGVDVLRGWVDPDGDPVVVASAEPAAGAPIVAMPGADGTLAIAHVEEAGGAGTYTVEVRLMDSHGAVSAPRDLVVTVEPVPGFTVTNGMALGRPGEWARVDVADHATGGSGSYRIADAVDVSSTLGELDIEWNPAGGSIDLRAAEAGSYQVSALVVDAVTQQQRTLHLRYQVGDPASVALPPLTAFVRPGEDTVVDVLAAASNTTGQVLLVTDAVSDTGALAAVVVDQSAVQLRSTDAGRALGPLGTVRLTATTADGRSAAGTLTAFLVPATAGVQPIALHDTATVRAGEVVDIAVLDNDIAPRGERLALHPDVTGSGADGELAFAAEGVLRYRAPAIPGTYTVFYYAYLPSSPTLLSRAQVTIQVLAPGANRAPQAHDVEARALAGRTVEIPIELDTIDPDGDRVTLTAVSQPARPELGAVMIGADGRSLRFTAPEARDDAPTAGWQADFEYTVRDTGGASDTARVRVGVSAQQLTDITPVVFTDHVQVRAGTTGPITVEPLSNDRDPALASLVASPDRGTGLRIIDLRPSMSGLADDPASPYATAAALLVPPVSPSGSGDAPDPYPDGVVTFQLAPDTRPGSYVYLYTVESRQSTSTAQALIVLTVTEAPSPDRPSIRDTTVTAADRGQLASAGIDVLGGKVAWATGDAAALAATLELAPGVPAGFEVRAGTSRIRGPLPADGAIVPFQVSGTDRLGADFTTYGFLRIPAFDDLRLTVAARPDPIREETSGDFDLAELLAIGDTDAVEVRADGPFTVHRPESSCGLVGGTTLRYHAGYYPMFTDSCTVQARLVGQSDEAWSTVVIPIDIEPKDPLAILTPLTLTLSITQAPARIDLYDSLVTWYGGRALDRLDDLAFSWEYAGSQFEVLPRSGTGTGPDPAVTVQALGDATTGTRETIRVGLRYTTADGFAYDETVNVVLYVGLAPPEHPAGARLSLQCNTRDDPGGCELPVILPTDTAGQFNPIRDAAGDTRLRLVGVGGGTAQTHPCPGVATVGVHGDALRFTWLPADDPAKPFGGQCTVPFTVQDTQGRTGQGQVSFTADGFPQRPDTPVTAAYGADWVDIDVPLGAATSAFPEVTGVELRRGAAAVPQHSCARLDVGTFRCRVSGLANGVEHIWQAVTRNAVGDSAPTAMQVPTNAYVAPRFTAGPTYATRQYDPAVTTPTSGILLVHEACADAGAESIRFVIRDAVTTRTVTKPVGAGGCVAADSDFGATPAPGGVQVTATAYSQFAPPVIGSVAGDRSGGSDTQTVIVRGAPTITAFSVTPNADNTRVDLHAAVDWHAGDGDIKVAFLAWAPDQPGTTAPSCTPAADGATSDGGSAFVDNSFTVNPGSGTARHVETSGVSASLAVDGSATGLAPNLRYTFRVCVTAGYGSATAAGPERWLVQDPGAPTAADMTYTPEANPATMNADHLTAPGPGVDGPEFVWHVPDTDPTNNAAADFAAQLAGIAAAAPAPAGSTWQVRYATGASDDPGDYTHTTIDDNVSTFTARFCFTAGGEDFCSSRSGPITPAPGTNVGVAYGGTASVTLPSAAVCTAVIGGLNAQIVQAGDAAVDARVRDLAAGQAATARNDRVDTLRSPEYLAWRDAYDPASPPDATGVDPDVQAAYLTGYPAGGYPDGFDDVYDPADPGGTIAAARQAGTLAAEAHITAEGQAAYDAALAAGTTPGHPEYDTNAATAESEGVRVDGFGAVAGEADEYAAVRAAAPGTPALRPATTGFTLEPLPTAPTITVDADDTTRRLGAVHYAFAAPPAGATMGYVLDAIRADYASYTCG